MRVLHISAHYGGGVGTAVSVFRRYDHDNEHTFTHLNDIPANQGPLFDVRMVEDCDIVLIHYWNHPSVFEFLVRTRTPPCRVAVWSHASGLYPPYAHPRRLVEYADKFIFTSPISHHGSEIRSLPDEQREKLDVIWSTHGVEHVAKPKPHDGFNVGLTGTVGYGKLHPRYIDMCRAVKSDVRFIVCSNDSQAHLVHEARQQNENRIVFMGRPDSLIPLLEKFDVFGYPLQRRHFGTCEQALGEAMASGAVPVVLGNLAERHIVKHMETGMICENPAAYSRAIDFLYHHGDALRRLSAGAMAAAKKQYDTGTMISRWNEKFDELMKVPKTPRRWERQNAAPHWVFVTSLGVHGRPFADYIVARRAGDQGGVKRASRRIRRLMIGNPMFVSASKGSPRQYQLYYPENRVLREWAELADEIGGAR